MTYHKEVGDTRDARNTPVHHFETFTHRQVLADGRVLYADPAARLWRLDGRTVDAPPAEWNPALALERPCRLLTWTEERDYS